MARIAKRRDFLKVRLSELLRKAQASIVQLRRVDLGAEDAAEQFVSAAQGLGDAGFQIQGLGDAVEARAKARDAAFRLAYIARENSHDGQAPGLWRGLRSEARRALGPVIQ